MTTFVKYGSLETGRENWQIRAYIQRLARISVILLCLLLLNRVYKVKFIGLIYGIRQYVGNFWLAQSPSNTQQKSGRSATVSGKTNVTKVEELIEIHVNYTIHGIAKATCISLSQIYLDAFYFEAHFASKKDFCQMDIPYMHIFTWPKT